MRVEHGRLEAGGNEKNERERKRARKIYTEDNISEQYFAGRSATQGDKEGERKRREWLIFGARGRSPLAGAKECLAFDLYPVPEVADAQTSSGTSRIVLAPSAMLVQGYFLPRPEDTKPTRHPAYNLCRNFIHAISRDPSRVPLQREIYI